MDRLALIGVSYRRGGAEALERWQRELASLYPQLLAGAGVREWVPLATCNRWDLILALPTGLEPERLRSRLTPPGSSLKPYLYVGEGALEQLTRIAASLDALNPGEDQIMNQVREAFALAQTRGTSGGVTAFAFHTALRIAKRVRRELALAPLNTSLFSLARPALEALLEPGDTVAVLGAGGMARLAAKGLSELAGVEILVVNRTPERADALAAELGVTSGGLGAFLASPPLGVRALVCAAAAAGLVDETLLERLPKLELIVDLGLPRNVRPGAAEAAGVTLLNVDTLRAAGEERREALADKLAAAEALVQSELEAAVAQWTERQLGTSIRQLKDLYLATIGDSLPPEDAARLAHKFAHVPVKGLRALARVYGLDAARVFLAETGLAE